MFTNSGILIGGSDRVRFLFLILLPLLLVSCSAPGKTVAGTDRRPPIEQAVGPGEVSAMLTGSWQSRNDDRSGMAILGGAIAYDMVTTERVEGRPVARKRLSAGPLFIAGRSERRALESGVEESRSHWLFPFYRYVVKGGKKTLYPLFFIPIPLGQEERTFTEPSYADLSPGDDPPWGEVTTDVDPEVEVVRSSEIAPERIPEGIWSQESPDPVSPGQTYRVSKGDTLYSLARRFYSDQRRWRSIHQANLRAIPDPDVLPVGIELVLP